MNFPTPSQMEAAAEHCNVCFTQTRKWMVFICHVFVPYAAVVLNAAVKFATPSRVFVRFLTGPLQVYVLSPFANRPRCLFAISTFNACFVLLPPLPAALVVNQTGCKAGKGRECTGVGSAVIG